MENIILSLMKVLANNYLTLNQLMYYFKCNYPSVEIDISTFNSILEDLVQRNLIQKSLYSYNTKNHIGSVFVYAYLPSNVMLSEIEELKEVRDSHERVILPLCDDVEENTLEIQYLHYLITEKEKTIKKIDNTILGINTLVMQLEKTVGNQRESIMELEKTVGHQGKSIMQLQKNMGDHSEIKNLFDEQNQRIQNLEEIVVTLVGQVDYLTEQSKKKRFYIF